MPNDTARSPRPGSTLARPDLRRHRKARREAPVDWFPGAAATFTCKPWPRAAAAAAPVDFSAVAGVKGPTMDGYLGFLEFFVVALFVMAWGVLELVGRRLDRKKEAEKAKKKNPAA